MNNSSTETAQTNPTMSLHDMIEGEDNEAQFDVNGDFILEQTSLRTGIGGNIEPEPERDAWANPNATHWVYNPYEIIDLTNQGAGSGMLFLKPIIFNRVRSLQMHYRKDIKEKDSDPRDQAHRPSDYAQYPRTAQMIADEMETKHGYKGVVIVRELTGMEGEAIEINKILFGDNVECVKDFNSPDHPCPVLPNLLETMELKVRRYIQSNEAEEDKDVVRAVAMRIRRSIRLAMQNARDRIEEGQKRLLDDKAVNRFLSRAEQRSYIALGLNVPTWQPTARGLSQQQVAPQTGDLAAAVAAGVAEAFKVNHAAAAAAVEPAVTDLVPIDELNKIAPPPPKSKPAEKVTVPTGTKNETEEKEKEQ